MKINRIDKEKELCEEGLAIVEKLYDSNNECWAEDYTKALNNLAVCHQANNHIDAAIKLYEKCHAITKKLYYDNNECWVKNYASCLNNLAKSYQQSIHFNKSIELLEEALSILEMPYKNNHKYWAELYVRTLNNLAYFYDKEYFLKKAIELIEIACSISKEYLDTLNPLAQESQKTHAGLKNTFAQHLDLNQQSYNQSYSTLLYLSNALAIQKNDKTITLNHLYDSLHYVKLSAKAFDFFSKIFTVHMQTLQKIREGSILLKVSQNVTQLLYNEQMKELVKILENTFGDELICSLR